MKFKKIKIVTASLIAIVGTLMIFPLFSNAQSSSLWKLTSSYLLPVVSSWGLQIPSLGSTGSPCLIVDSNGKVSTSTCGSTLGPGTLNYVSKFTGSGTTIGNSKLSDDGTQVFFGAAANNTATPVISVTNDTDTGIEWSNNNVLNFVAGGKRMIRADGTSGNTFKFNVDTLDTDYYFYTSTGRGIVIDSGNNRVGIGTGIDSTQIKNQLDVAGNAVFGSGYAEVQTAPTNGVLVQGYLGVATTSPYAPLSVAGQIVGAYYTATTSTASLFPYASTTMITASIASSTDIYLSSVNGSILKTTASKIVNATNGTDYTLITANTCSAGQHVSAIAANGTVTCSADTGGSGGGGGTWSTTTSNVANRFINYPNNDTDIVTIGSNSTTTAEYWFDPNTSTAYHAGNVNIGTTTFISSVPLNVFGPTGEGTILSQSGLNNSYAGILIRDYLNQNAASFQYGNPSASSFTNQFVLASRQASIPIVIYQGGTAATNQRLIFSSTSASVYTPSGTAFGIGTTTPYAPLSVVGQVVGAYFAATTSTASSFPYASTTMFTFQTASTTNFFGGDLFSCNSASNALTWSNGKFGCNSISGSGTVSSGVAGQLAWYASNGTAVSGTSTWPLTIGSLISTTTATSTFAGPIEPSSIYTKGVATSTFTNGINLSTGCFSINGTCVGGGGSGLSGGFDGLSMVWTGATTAGASSSPTHGFITATSTTATSTIAGRIKTGYWWSDEKDVATTTSTININGDVASSSNQKRILLGAQNATFTFFNYSNGGEWRIIECAPPSGLIGSTTYQMANGTPVLWFDGDPGSPINNKLCYKKIFTVTAASSTDPSTAVVIGSYGGSTY